MGLDGELAARINTGIREAVYATLSFIPLVGGVFGGITNTLWPDGPSLSLWDQVRQDVEALVSELIDNERANAFREELDGLGKQALLVEATDPTESKDNFIPLRGAVVRQSGKYCDDKAPWVTLPYFVGMCTFHLGIEKHRIDHWTELYPGHQYNDKARDEQALSRLVDSYIAAAGAIRAECIKWRKSKVVNDWKSGMGFVKDNMIPEADWKYESRDDAVRSRVVERRFQNIEAEYGSLLDAILSPSEMWLWFKPDMAPKLLENPMNGGPMRNFDRWGRKTVYDMSGPYPNFPRQPRFDPSANATSFNDRTLVETYCFTWTETVKTITWWAEDVRQSNGNIKYGERVTGIRITYGRILGAHTAYDTELRGRKAAKEYSISRPADAAGLSTEMDYISDVEIVCGDKADKAPIEALAITWTNVSSGAVRRVGQTEFIDGLPNSRFGVSHLRAPRATATELGNRWLFDPPRMAFISGSHTKGVGLVWLGFHWKINQYD